MAESTRPSRLLVPLAALLLFACTLAGLWLRSGSSARLWVDTLNDERQVHHCLKDRSCPGHGAPVSFGSLLQGASWQQLRSVQAALGLGLGVDHLLWLGLEAAALTLLLLLAFRLGGGVGALLAGLSALLCVESTECWRSMLWNFRPLVALGALTLCLQTAMVRARARPGLALALLAGAVAGIALNIHLVAAPLVLGLAITALLSTPGRWRKLALVSLGFGLVSALGSAGAWGHNLGALLGVAWVPSAGEELRPSGFWLSPAFILGWLILAAALAGSGRIAVGRRPLFWGLLAAAGGGLLLFTLGQLFLRVTPTDRYLLPVLPALALLATLAMTAWRPDAGKSRPGWNALVWVLPLALALVFWPAGGRCDKALVRLDHRDSFLAELHEQGLGPARGMFQVRGPGMHLLFEGWRPGGGVPKAWPSSRGLELLPCQALPPAARRGARRFAETWCGVELDRRVDWSRPEIFRGGSWKALEFGEITSESGKPAYQLSGFPDPAGAEGALRLRYHVGKGHAGSGDMAYASPAFSPCRGVLEIEDCAGCRSGPGRRSVYVPEGEEALLQFRFELGSRDCPLHAYQGFVPWVAELPHGIYAQLYERNAQEFQHEGD